jgi:hypothetical protein
MNKHEVTPLLSSSTIAREFLSLDAALSRTQPLDSTFDPKTYSAKAVQRAQDVWRNRMGTEYGSTTVFSQVAGQMVEAGATLDTTAVMLRMAQDELRHTRTCGDVVIALGGEARLNREAVLPTVAKHANVSREECALRNVIYTTCISEMFSVAYLTTSVELCKDPYLRGATRMLLSDEILHGRFGFAYVEAWQAWLTDHPEARDATGRYLQYAFAVAEREFGSWPRHAPLTEDELALGLVSSEVAHDLYAQTMRVAVVPVLEGLGLAAEQAFRTRTLCPGSNAAG